MKHRSFADPRTHFTLVRSREGEHDGHHVGELTGVVKCDDCGAAAYNLDAIDHALVDGEECPQHDVHSEYFRATHPAPSD